MPHQTRNNDFVYLIMNKLIKYDWTSGRRFGMVMLTGKSYMDNGKRKVEVICDCGKIVWVSWQNTKIGQNKSCGCLKTLFGERFITHGLRYHPLYKIWTSLKGRCYNINNPRYILYGGTGVTVCDEWRNDFKAFHDWALENGWVSGLDIDKDILYNKKFGTKTGKIYSPEFCCFVSHQENCEHTSRTRLVEYNGVTKKHIQMVQRVEIGLPYNTKKT